jgi:hypothetical protein
MDAQKVFREFPATIYISSAKKKSGVQLKFLEIFAQSME